MREFISVVIPAYEEELTIRETIESVLRQTYPYFEVIVVDDCSLDQTYEVAKDISQKDERVFVVRNEKNKGVAFSRNKGVELSKHEWVAFLDGDDLWCNNKLELQIEAARNKNADIIYTSYGYLDSEGNYYDSYFLVPEQIAYKELLKQNCISCSGVMLKKKYLKDYPMEKDNLHEDFYTWLRVIKSGAKAVGVKEVLHFVRIAMKDSKSGNKMKSAKMTFDTYRAIGLSVIEAIFYFIHYSFKSVKKYLAIKKAKQCKTHLE